MFNREEILQNSGRTAISRTRMSKPLRVAIENEFIDPYGANIFEWGHGRGSDMVALHANDDTCRVFGWDPNHYVQGFSVEWEPTPDRMRLHWIDYHLCTYVLNVLPSQERVQLVNQIYQCMHDGAGALFSVRGKAAVNRAARMGKWAEYDDGWVTESGTFQRGFRPVELLQMLFRAGFKVVKITGSNPVIAYAERRDA